MSAWRELKAKGDSDDVRLSPIELAIYNLWYETNGFEQDAEKAAAELSALRADLAAMRAERDGLKEALSEAVEIIRQWHNMRTAVNLSEEQYEFMWKIYREKSPEMKRIATALGQRTAAGEE